MHGPSGIVHDFFWWVRPILSGPNGFGALIYKAPAFVTSGLARGMQMKKAFIHFHLANPKPDTLMTATRKPKALHHHSRNGSFIDNANRLGQDAKQIALQAAHDMGEAIELRIQDTSSFFQDTWKLWEKKAVKNPGRAFSCILGAGVLIGMWLRRR